MFIKAINDSSYSVAGSALTALGNIDSVAGYEKAKALSSQKVKGSLQEAITNTLYLYAGENDFDSLAVRFERLPLGNAKFMILQPFAGYLKRTKDTDNFKKGIDIIAAFRDGMPPQIKGQVDPYINGMILNGIASSKQAAGLTEQADYVKSKIPVKPKAPEANATPK